jgi:hypothetical protein
MKCKGCKREILDSEEYTHHTLVPKECEEGYRKFGMAPSLIYCSDCSNSMRRYIFEKNNQPERSKREDMEGPSHIPDRGWPDKNAGFP